MFDYKPVLPALLPRISTNVAGNTARNLNEGWAVGGKRIVRVLSRGNLLLTFNSIHFVLHFATHHKS
jgi:hypothetical protein